MKIKYITILLALISAWGVQAQTEHKHDCKGDCKEAAEWMAKKDWSNGFNVAPDKSVNAKEFMQQYNKNKALWDKVFKFLATTDLKNLPVGTTDIEKGRAWVTVSEYVPRTADKVRAESHRKFIDLQYTLWGNEKMGLAHDVEVLNEYNEGRDVAFWKTVDYFKAGPDSFFLFFPSDLHMPSVLDGEPVKSKKIVVKIEYAK